MLQFVKSLTMSWFACRNAVQGLVQRAVFLTARDHPEHNHSVRLKDHKTANAFRIQLSAPAVGMTAVVLRPTPYSRNEDANAEIR